MDSGFKNISMSKSHVTEFSHASPHVPLCMVVFGKRKLNFPLTPNFTNFYKHVKLNTRNNFFTCHEVQKVTKDSQNPQESHDAENFQGSPCRRVLPLQEGLQNLGCAPPRSLLENDEYIT